MRKTILKLLALTLALLMILPVAIGCKKNEEEQVTDDTVSTGDSLHPVPPQDLGGKEFEFATSKWAAYAPLDFVDIYVEAYTGDFVVDAAYTRNLYMESNFNCTVKQRVLEANAVVTELEKNALAGDDAFDFALFRGSHYTASVNGGYLASIYNFDIDTENSWWDANAIDTMTINGKCYALVGDVSTNHLLATYMTCFNKTLIENNGFDSPYTLVENGTWTLEKMVEMAKSVADDSLDGNAGEMGREDLWGIHYTCDNVPGLLTACGVKITKKNAAGAKALAEMVITDYTSQIQDVLKLIYDETYATDTIGRKVCKASNSDTEFFDKGQVLFLLTATHNAQALRNSDVEYGIVPYPKFNEESDYIASTAGNYFAYLGIPLNNADVERSSVFLEAYAAQGQKEIRPQFYENMLLRKVGRDAESSEMLSYIFENLTYDIGAMFDIAGGEIRNSSATQNANVSSLVGNNRNTWKSELNDILKAYKDEEPTE